MINIKSATRMSLSIGIGCASLVWIAIAVGLIQDPVTQQAESRIQSTKAIAANVSTFTESHRLTDLKKTLERMVMMDDSVLSVGVLRRRNRSYLLTVGPHAKNWISQHENDPAKQIGVEILGNKSSWGMLEVTFAPYEQTSQNGFAFPFGLVLFLFSATSLLSWVVLSRSLKYLNPSKVVPNRVRSALDTLAEGLVLVDGSGEIAHANAAFCSIAKVGENEILGKKLDEFNWMQVDDRGDLNMPWHQCLEKELRVTGEVIQLKVGNEPTKKFAVNATPILNGEDAVRGALISFDDVTALENKNTELAKIIGSLRSSRDEVSRQNVRLNFLASYDPLTKCMNRRAFFGEFEKYWADEDCLELNLLMLDVDHFKAVNDNHGHSVGDEVLKAMGDLLRDTIGEQGLVCRYGGEEFVVLVPNRSIDECEKLANDVRKLIEKAETCGIHFTASLGVSCREFKPMDPQHMLDQADESLYTAKRSGRNRVVRYDQRKELEAIEEALEDEPDIGDEIPYSAVTGLLSALSFRCTKTAEHSIRVADLCVVVGQKMMNHRGLYRLEVAALLHDIGKIGVPDSILHKPGPLNSDEWAIMRKHDSIGGEIVRNALASDQLAKHIESHHFCASLRNLSVPRPEVLPEIPLASRIITVCDAFDAMTHDRVYRAAISAEEALIELSKSPPEQFDPEVIEILTEYVRSGYHKPGVDVGRSMFSSRQATAIGQHIEQLYIAIEEEDVEKLQTVVHELRKDTVDEGEVSDVADRLDEAIDGSDDDLEDVLRLASDLMQLCRGSRNSFIDAAETIVGTTK